MAAFESTNLFAFQLGETLSSQRATVLRTTALIQLYPPNRRYLAV
jgi:hypothetical protein